MTRSNMPSSLGSDSELSEQSAEDRLVPPNAINYKIMKCLPPQMVLRRHYPALAHCDCAAFGSYSQDRTRLRQDASQPSSSVVGQDRRVTPTLGETALLQIRTKAATKRGDATGH